MERRKALALASTATLVVGSTIVSVASVSGASFLGFGSGSSHTAAAGTDAASSAPGVVRKTRNIYDRYVVDLGGGSTDTGSTGSPRAATVAVAGPADFAVGDAPGTSTPDASPPTTQPAAKHHTPSEVPGPTPTSEPEGPPTTAPPTTTPPTTASPTTAPPRSTTTMPTTTTTWPRGVPRDWPKDKPIPPMPPNCRQPQLEDNGVWNCDH